MTPRTRWLALWGIAVVLATEGAGAQESDTVTAEALFQDGRELLDQNRFVEACPKLAESHRLDPATGTLIALAMCREGEGKLASAWATFTEASARAAREGNQDRQTLASERAALLRPRLSKLTIEVPGAVASIEGVEIKRDGLLLGRGAWNAAVPIDGGDHVIEVVAANRTTWRTTATIKGEGDAVKVVVEAPAEIAAPEKKTSAPASPAARASQAPEEASAPFGPLEWAGVGSAGAGVVVLGIGGYFLGSALGEHASANREGEAAYCGADDFCGDVGLSKRKSARASGNVATALGIGGAVLVGGGAALYFVGRSSATREGSRSPRLGVALSGASDGVLLRVQGAY